MTFTETSIIGAYLVDLNPIRDGRGFFSRAWSCRAFGDRELVTHFPEINLSTSTRMGTIRGLHYQKEPNAEAKFVRCIRGSFFDVVIDLRLESSSYLQWAGFLISSTSYQGIYVPAGCAHGVQTMEDNTEMLYMVSALYTPAAEAGIRWNDPFFGIDWPDVGQRIVSEKDQAWPHFNSTDIKR